jgi:hypothetical protein
VRGTIVGLALGAFLGLSVEANAFCSCDCVNGTRQLACTSPSDDRFTCPGTECSPEDNGNSKSSCRYWLSTPDREWRMANLTTTLVEIQNHRTAKNVGWSMSRSEKAKAAKEACALEPQKSLADVVVDLYVWLEVEGK